MANPDKLDLNAVEARLRDRAAELRQEIREALERSSDESHVRIAEQARDREDDSFANLVVDVTYAEVERDADELRRIDGALRRIAEGTYGLCEMCGGEIAPERLEAEPTATRCIRCQELYEKTHASTEAPRL
ncbi:MAG: conjugal transfer protein TraR [Proteobacteria bacterium]|nr:MAG: conjugal transfer protein TraR [Pseudomonadota bacterium]